MKCGALFAQCWINCQVYWQCPVKGCGFELAYCIDHGGTDRVQEEMGKHIQDHYVPTPTEERP